MPVIYREKESVDALSEKDIRNIINSNQFLGLHYKKLNDYYTGKHAILEHIKKDGNSPNNKIIHNMAKYITDTATGYFIGQPVVYNSDNTEQLEIMQDIFNYNDEQDHNMELARQCSIQGSCFEMLYIDEDCKIRLARVSRNDLIMIYEAATGNTTPLAAIRMINSTDKNGNRIRRVEYWNSSQTLYFQGINGGEMQLEEIREHYWNDIPFVEYINNEERIGDFEGVISEIDAYNKVQSNTANYFEYNDDALLTVSKMGAVSADEIKEMREAGAVILEEGGEIKWLLKTVDDTALENYKNRLREDIYQGANVPNMTDEAFGGTMSGVAVSYKLWGMDQNRAIKERKFKKGLQRRIELITNMLNIQGHHFDYRDIQMKFRVNKPQNVLEIAQIITTLANDLSRETRLQMLPFVEDVKAELDKLDAEKQISEDEFGVYGNFVRAFRLDEANRDETEPDREEGAS